jgi:hypothetical protein
MRVVAGDREESGNPVFISPETTIGLSQPDGAGLTIIKADFTWSQWKEKAPRSAIRLGAFSIEQDIYDGR